MTRVVVDTETTGLGVNTPGGARPDGVIQIGMAWRSKSGDLVSTKFEANPGEEFYANGRADAAFKVNGYTIDRVRRLPPATTVADFVIRKLKEIEQREGSVVTIAAYNSPFDAWFLGQAPWLITADRGFPWEPDLMVRAAKAAGVPAGQNGHRFTLRAAMEHAGIERYGSAHDAESDAVDALKLAEWLDAQATVEGMKNRESPTGVVEALRAYLRDNLDRGSFPIRQEEKRGSVNPSDLWMCPRAYWARYHGTPRDDDPFFAEIKSPMSGIMEKIVLDRLADSGLWVKRGEFVSDGIFSGKLDGRVEFPKGTRQWMVVEVKSSWNAKTLQAALSYPSPAWLDQIECYLRMTGIDTGLLAVFHMGDPAEPSEWEIGYRAFRMDDARWARIREKSALFLVLQRPEAKAPDHDDRCRGCGA